MQQYVVIKTKLHRSHILVIVHNLPLETVWLSAYSKNTIAFAAQGVPYEHVPKL